MHYFLYFPIDGDGVAFTWVKGHGPVQVEEIMRSPVHHFMANFHASRS